MNRWTRFGLIAAVLAGAIYLIRPFIPYVEFALPFNKGAWLALEDTRFDDFLHVRGHMAYGLIQSRRLVGMSRDQVVALLGPPPPTDKFGDWDIVYWLGPDTTTIPMDSEWLVMRLGAGGQVSEARLVED